MDDTRTEFDYLLNRMDRAAMAKAPVLAGYGNHRLALLAHVRALERDAARYRWLRHGDNGEICIEFREGCDCYGDDAWLLRGDRLDATIDAAIDAEKRSASAPAQSCENDAKHADSAEHKRA